MWVYEQSTGRLSNNGAYVATGYSGFEDGRNNPMMQRHHDLGPLPVGYYTMQVIADGEGKWVDYEGKAAPVIRLIPDKENQMYGRDGFLMHGDSRRLPGTASHGCIVEDFDARCLVAESADNRLQVL